MYMNIGIRSCSSAKEGNITLLDRAASIPIEDLMVTASIATVLMCL